MRAALEQECRDRDIADAVIFTGYRPDIADVLGALDIKAFTSLWEGLPRVLVQASAAGVPVVSFEVGGAWEVVEHGVNGYLVPIKDTAGMVHYLDQLIVDPDARDRIASQARDHAGERFSIAQNIARIESLYRKVAPEVHAS